MVDKQQRVFLLTGANKGIGLEIVKKLNVKQPDDIILLGSRDQQRGKAVLKQLGSPKNVKVLLDTSSLDSIQKAKQEIQQKYDDHLGTLINNAGIFQFSLDSKPSKETTNTNFEGVTRMNETFFPLIKDNGRVVSVSSELRAIQMNGCSNELKKEFRNPNLTKVQLDDLLKP
ncbi:unnamed protein product, partial [Didymodactylos carnosus]